LDESFPLIGLSTKSTEIFVETVQCAH